MGKAKAPKMASPTESAKAMADAMMAGQQFEMANAPMKAYAETMNQAVFNPFLTDLQTSLNNRSAKSAAMAQQDILNKTNPGAYLGQQALQRYSGNKLAEWSGIDPASIQPDTQGVYDIPETNQLPNVNVMSDMANAIAAKMKKVKIDKKGRSSIEN